MPEGVVPGTKRIYLQMPTALRLQGLKKSFGGLPAINDGLARGRGGRAWRLIIHRAERRRQDHALQPDHGGPCGGRWKNINVEKDISKTATPTAACMAGLARTYQIITLFAKDTLEHNITLLRLSALSAGRDGTPSPLLKKRYSTRKR